MLWKISSLALLGFFLIEGYRAWPPRLRTLPGRRMLRLQVSQDSSTAPKLNFDEDYYSVLEVDPSISQKDLKREYYKIVYVIPLQSDPAIDLTDE